MAYIIFAIFIVFVIDFVLDFVQPYTNVLNFDIEQKEVLLAYESGIPDVFSAEDLNSLCSNLNVTKLQGTKITYTALGFVLPAWDVKTVSPETTSGRVTILRKNKNLEILFGSTSTSYNVRLELVYPEDANPVVISENTESGDFFNISEDAFKNKVIIINTTFAGDLDKFEVKTDPASNKDVIMVFISAISGIIRENVLIGETPMNNSCQTGKLGEHSQIFGNSLMLANGSKIPVKIDMETWWLR